MKQYFVDMANAQIGDVTEGKHKPGHADLTHVSLNGAFDTLIATVGTFIDPVQFADRISFLFGERETERQRLDELHIPYRIIPSSGHGAFEKKASVIARMIR